MANGTCARCGAAIPEHRPGMFYITQCGVCHQHYRHEVTGEFRPCDASGSPIPLAEVKPRPAPPPEPDVEAETYQGPREQRNDAMVDLWLNSKWGATRLGRYFGVSTTRVYNIVGRRLMTWYRHGELVFTDDS